VSNVQEPAQDDAWAALMARAQAGDTAAYRRLLVEIAPYLRALAARSMRDRADIEDCVQDVLLTIHTIRHTYDPARPFKPWLVAIARRRIIDRLRGRSRRRARETFLAPDHETFVADETNSYAAEPDGWALREALARLPEGQRKAVTMLKLEEKSLKETSAATGMSVTALKVSTHRAIKALRKMLYKESEEI
jgi:RNA polymerase sigma-70 factor (ECF subfamily)